MGIDLAGFVWTLVRTDFKVRYHGTAMGFLWALLKPISMVLVLFGVFSLIFGQEPHYRMNLLLGLFLWDFFAEGTKVGLISLQTKGFLISKSRFPRWIVVVASSSNALITLLTVSAAFLLVLAISGLPFHWAGVPFFLLYIVLFALIVIGISLGASVMFMRYRDLNQVWEVVTNAGFFVAPVVYPLGIIPERYHFFLYAWPPTPIIMFSRQVLVDGTVPTFKAHLMLVGMTVALLGVGAALFARQSPRIAERL